MVLVSSLPGEQGLLVMMGLRVLGPQEPGEPMGLFLPWGAR
jgi:hypothetical protein